MSCNTWKQQHYKTEASECPVEDAISHTVAKWEGMHDEQLDFHGMKKDHCVLYDCIGGRIRFNNMNCALCHHYIDLRHECPQCPIVRVTKRSCLDPYTIWLATGNAKPALDVLYQVNAAYMTVFD